MDAIACQLRNPEKFHPADIRPTPKAPRFRFWEVLNPECRFFYRMAEKDEERSDSDVGEEAHRSKRRRYSDKLFELSACNDLATSLGLQYYEILFIPKVEFLWTISTSTSYLYHIASLILNTPTTNIELLRQDDGVYRDPVMHNGWKRVGKNQDVLHGSYLCRCFNLGIFFLHSSF
jgi:hypothetical protein